MAAFSRGLYSSFHKSSLGLPPSLRAAIFAAKPQIYPSRAPVRKFASSTVLSHAAPTRTPSRAVSPVEALFRTVQTSRAPMLLYKAPPRRKVFFRVYGWGSIVMGIGLYSWYFLKHLPQQQPFFVAPTYAVIGFMFVAVGIHIFQRPVRRISTLELIPGPVGRPQLRVRAHISPWAREREFIVETWQATLSEKLQPMVKEIEEANRARKQSITSGLGHMSIVPRYWEIAARWIEQRWTSFFLKFKFAVLQFGIAEIEVEGAKLKLDCDGWLLEDGKVIDRMLAEK